MSFHGLASSPNDSSGRLRAGLVSFTDVAKEGALAQMEAAISATDAARRHRMLPTMLLPPSAIVSGSSLLVVTRRAVTGSCPADEGSKTSNAFDQRPPQPLNGYSTRSTGEPRAGQ